MEHRPRHSEWAKLKLVGRPVITGTALGPSSLLWVACRTSPYLVHLYEDSRLRALIRFPEDPIFLLFGPPCGDSIELYHRTGLKWEPVSGSLLVITSDGCIWHIVLVNSCISRDRPAKRLKQKFLREQEETVSRVLPSRSKVKTRSGFWSIPVEDAGDELDLFQDSDIYKDTDLYPCDADNAKPEFLCGSSKNGCIQLKLLKLHVPEDTSEKLQVTYVQPEALVGKFPGAFAAAFGPQNLLAVISPSAFPIVLKSTSPSTSLSSEQGSFPSDSGISSKLRRASCLLFVTKVEGGKKRSCWEGAFLSQSFFDILAREFKSIKPKHLLLQGNMAGEVHIYPVEYPEQTSSSTVFCDLQEPIIDLIAVPFNEDSDALLVVGANGRVVGVSPGTQECTGSPFLSTHSGSPFAKLFQGDLKDGFGTNDWRFRAPLISPTMIGPKQLCFCSASKVCIADLGGNTSDRTSDRFMHGTKSSMELQGGLAFNKSTLSKCIQIADIVIAVVGKGPFIPVSNTRCLVALTSRGRLMQLDISESVLCSDVDGIMMRAQYTSWKSGLQKKEDDIRELIREITMVESYAKTFHGKFDSMNFAISELSSALWLAFDVLHSRSRQLLQAPHLKVPPSTMNGIQCSIEVTPVVSNVPAERLCFEFCSEFQPSKSCEDVGGGHFDLGLQIKVSLFNNSLYLISPYWTLLLWISNDDSAANGNSTNFSSIINDGYGLAPGGKCIINFQVLPPGKWPSPLVACIFICHTQENHINIGKLSPASKAANARSQMNVSENVGQGSIKALCDDMATQYNTHGFRAPPGAVCILLARYRLDILSLIRSPRKPQYSFQIRVPILSHSLNSQESNADMVNAEAELFGTFSGKLRLRCIEEVEIPIWNELNSVQKWQEWFLEELIEYCSLSKNGDQLTASDHKGGTISLSLDHSMTERKGLFCREILVLASSLLPGCAARESILWRLSKQRNQLFTDKERREKSKLRNEERSILLGKHNHMIDVIEDTERRLEIVLDMKPIANFWKGMRSDCYDVSPQSINQAHSVVKRLIETYRRYREDALSAPFLIL